jgi:hypothetical protein
VRLSGTRILSHSRSRLKDRPEETHMSLITRILLGAAAALLSSAWLGLVGLAAAASVAAGGQHLDRAPLSAYHPSQTLYVVHRG